VNSVTLCFKTVAVEMLNQVPFQFQLRTLFVFVLSASVALTWFAWLDTGSFRSDPVWGILAWWPGWLGVFAAWGFAGSLLIAKREPHLASQMFAMAWLLVCINVADTGYDIVTCYHSSVHQLPRTNEAIEQSLCMIRVEFTPFIVLMPLFLLRRELLQSVFRTRLARLFYFVTLCDSVLLVWKIRYLFTRTPMV
jgi:hypothetical protein